MSLELLRNDNLSDPKTLEEYLIANIYLYKYYLNIYNLNEANKIYKDLVKLILNTSAIKILPVLTKLKLKSRFYEAVSYAKGIEGDYNTALEYIEKSLHYEKAIQNKTKATEFQYYTCAPLFTKKYFYLSALDANQNTYDELKFIYDKALQQAVLKKTKYIGMLLVILGESMGISGKQTVAENTIKQGLHILVDWYGNKYNKDIAHARIILGDLYYRNNNFLKAQHEYLTALAILDKYYESWNVDYRSRLLYKLVLNSLQLNDVFTAKAITLTHSRIFGKNHERSFIMRKKTKNLECLM